MMPQEHRVQYRCKIGCPQNLLLLALVLDSAILESLSPDPDLAKVRVSADALNALLSARAPLFVRVLVIQLVTVSSQVKY